MFKKEDIKPGMVVSINHKLLYVTQSENGIVLMSESHKHFLLDRFDNNLVSKCTSDEIDKVYGFSNYDYSSLEISINNRKLLWKRPNWEEVEVDTPILVKNTEDGEWKRRYFCKYEDGKVFAYCYGRTSWTTIDDDDNNPFMYAELAFFDDE